MKVIEDNVKENKKKEIENAMSLYENIRQCLYGLSQILKINFHEKNFYYQAGVDNLKALNDNILDLLKISYPPREVRIKLRELEYDELEAERSYAI